MELGRLLREGALWTYLQGWFGTVLQFATGIVLARILDPADFGAFFAVSAFTSVLLRQVQFGIPEALLQAKELDDEQWDSAFWFMEGLALLCCGIVFTASGWLQGFYNELHFSPLMRWMSVTFFLMPFMAINGAILRRRMQYKTLAKLSVVTAPLGMIIGITAALSGAGPFTFVISGVCGAALSAALLAYVAPWRPSWRFSASSLKPLFAFGWRVHANSSLNLLASKADNMLVGRLVGIQQLGIYNRAFSLSRMPVTELLTKLYHLFFASFSRIQDNQRYTFNMYQKLLCAMTSAIFPMLLFFIFSADGFIYLLYGEKWLPAALPVRIMAVGSFALVIAMSLGALSDAQGLVGREIPIQAANLAMTVLAVVIGAHWGLEGVAAGIAGKSFVVLVLQKRMMQRSHLGIGWRTIVEAVLPALIATAAAATVGYAVMQLADQLWMRTSIQYVFSQAAAITITYVIVWFALARVMAGNVPLQANAVLFKEIMRRVIPIKAGTAKV